MRRRLLVSNDKQPGRIISDPEVLSLTYNGSNQDLITPGTGTGVMMYSLDNSSFSSSIPQGLNAGNYTIYYYSAESANYNKSSTYSIQCTIDKAPGEVTSAPTAKSLTYNGGAQELVNAGSGTGTMQYSTDNSSWSVSIPTGTNAAGYTVYYKVAVSENYTESTSGSVGVTINKADQSAPTASGSTVTYSATAYASASGGGGHGSIQWSNGSSRSAIGSQSTQARWSGDSNYNASGWSNSVTLTVNKATGKVNTAPTNRGVTYNGGNQNLVNAGSGTGTMYYKLNNGGWSTSIPVASGAGSYTVYYYAAESTYYTQSGTGSLIATIGKANQSAPTAYGSSVWEGSTATASASGGGGQGSIQWSNGNSRTAVGSQSTSARWTGNSNYNASGWSNSVSLVVNSKYNGYSYVDLGLPSGVKWASYNVGASSWTGDGDKYGWCKGSTKYSSSQSRYTGSYSTSVDTARQVMGGLWRYPTIAEVKELMSNCTITGMQSGGRIFAKLTSKKNSNTVYFPLCGYYNAGESSISRANQYIRFWTSEQQDATYGKYGHFAGDAYHVGGGNSTGNKAAGYSVRGVIN